MRILSFGAHLTQLTRYPHVFPVSAYLVREDDGLTLIDCNLPDSAPAILAAAAAIGAPIVRIVLTHAHMDHVGSLDALHTALPAAEVIVPAREARFLTGDKRLDRDETIGKLRGGFTDCTTRPSRTILAGERIGSLEAIATPGHTPGHTAYLDTRDGSLIAGDALMTQGGPTVAGDLRWSFPLGPLTVWHRQTALASARALRARESSRLAVGHGPVIERPLAALDAAIARAARNFGEEENHAAG